MEATADTAHGTGVSLDLVPVRHLGRRPGRYSSLVEPHRDTSPLDPGASLLPAPCEGCALVHSEDVCPRCGRPRRLDPDYLSLIHHLAEEVVHAAIEEDAFEVYLDEEPKTPLQRSITRLARSIKHWHYDGDGCLEGE